MKVLHVFGGGVRSGVESYVLAIATGLKGQGIEHVLAPLRDGPFISEAEGLGLRVRKVNKKFKGDPLTIYRLRKIIKDEQASIVHTNAENGNLYGRLAAAMAKTPRVVSTIHTFYDETLRDRYRSEWVRNLIYRQDLLTSRTCDALITVNAAIKERLVMHGVAKEKIVVIPNGIGPSRYEHYEKEVTQVSALRARLGIAGDEMVVGTVARLSPVKNVAALVLAGKSVTDRLPKARFVIVGDGPQRQRLEKLASSLGVTSRLIFAGWQEDINQFLSIMDVFVITSLIEGSSFAILDAMALGKPVIATNVGGNPELVVDGETGRLVPFNDIDALTSSIVETLTNKDRAARMGRAGRERVQTHFRLDQMLEKTETLYRMVMKSWQ
ncbi:glycosyltransferase [Candidatus Poribacteria bacterium]|nr:glycosyltransferase [Candidatus Poribacteria bacterium]